jgi:hypothetical protein
MTYFLIVYDRTSGKIIQLREFDSSMSDEALDERFKLEMETRDRPEVEVVLLGGSSFEAIKRTHGRYFRELSEDALDDSGLADLRDLTARLGNRAAS